MASFTVDKIDRSILKDLRKEATDNGSTPLEVWRKKMLSAQAKILLEDPKQYRRFGPYWWLVKHELIAEGYTQFGDTVDAEWYEKMDYGDWVDNILAAWFFGENSIDNGLIYSELHIINVSYEPDEYEAYTYYVIDEEMELVRYL